MGNPKHSCGSEPVISVGLVQGLKKAAFWLDGDFRDPGGLIFPKGEYDVSLEGSLLNCKGPKTLETKELVLDPCDLYQASFSVETTIGVNFHWEQKERQRFKGGLKVLPDGEGSFTF